MKVIAVSGYKGSGKDTVANYLVKEHSFKREAFADKLKNMVADTYKIPYASVYEQNLKELPLLEYPVESKDKFTAAIHDILKGEFAELEGKLYWTPRALCILEGSIKRAVNSSYWVESVISSIKSTRAYESYANDVCGANGISDKFVISDLRYKSEVEQLRAAFGKELVTVRINRFDSSPSTDASERDLDDYEFNEVIDNKGTLEELFQKINKII